MVTLTGQAARRLAISQQHLDAKETNRDNSLFFKRTFMP
jgi:hypothetical protein